MSDKPYIEFRKVRYMTAAAFKKKKVHPLIGTMLEVRNAPIMKAEIVGVDLMRRVALYKFEEAVNPDKPDSIYGIISFDGVNLIKESGESHSSAAYTLDKNKVKDYLENLKEVYRDPDKLTCKQCGWSGDSELATIKAFFKHDGALSMREGDDYHCPECDLLLAHYIKRMS